MSMSPMAAARNTSVASMRRRRSHRSVNAPAGGPSATEGRYSAATVRPDAVKERVIMKTCAGTATTSNHEPRVLTSRALHSSRKSRIRSACNATLPAPTLSTALGMHLSINLTSADASPRSADPAGPLPASLVRLSRTQRFRRDARLLAETLEQNPEEFSASLIDVLAQTAHALGKNLNQSDWHRLLDALLLLATYPNTDR